MQFRCDFMRSRSRVREMGVPGPRSGITEFGFSGKCTSVECLLDRTHFIHTSRPPDRPVIFMIYDDNTLHRSERFFAHSPFYFSPLPPVLEIKRVR